jgi:hypothetical protein
MPLDPVREARVRRMVPDRSTWPGGVLRMKRLHKAMPDFGAVLLMTEGRVAILVEYPVETTVAYPDLDALIAAGWAVD